MKRDRKYSKAVHCCTEGNDPDKKRYEQFDFAEIDSDEDEIVKELKL